MDSNKVYDKLMNFAMETKTFAEFQKDLFESRENNPIRVAWETLEGNNRYYWMFWIDGPIGNGIEGGTDTKAAEDMVNIRVLGLSGDWRTLDYSSVSKYRYNGQTFKVI
jgi:hypothetical protein